MNTSKPIFISLSPNTEKDDVLLALKLIFQPWKWKKGRAVELLENKFKKYLNAKNAFAFNSGRTAFLAILHALGLGKGDEILLQAFTCNAVVNPIIWSGLKPIYVDIEKQTLSIDQQDLERKITSKSRVVLVQHTFGLPADMDRISEICQKHNLILIEDCAHSLGATYKGRKVGTFGKAAFFSLGRDKVISSVYGGMAVTNDSVLAGKIKTFQENCPKPFRCWILQQLLHPILTKAVVMPFYRFFGFGKYILVGLQKLKIISKAVTEKEKRGKQPEYFPQKMSNALAVLGLNQFKKLERFNKHRNILARFYDKELSDSDFALPLKQEGRIYMRYPVLVKNNDTDKYLNMLRKHNVFLDDGWRKKVIVPPDTEQKKMGYLGSSCPVAEEVANSIMNLPTHINITKNQAQKIKNLLRDLKNR